VSGDNFDITKNCVPYLSVGEVRLLSDRLTFTQIEDDVFLSALISDTIYKYDAIANDIIPEMVFKGKYRPFSEKDIKGMKFETGMDALRFAEKKKFSRGIGALAMTKTLLHFTIQYDGVVYRVFWNRKTKQGSISEVVNEKSVLGLCFANLRAATEDAFIAQIDAESMLRIDWDENESAKKAAENTLEDDNPIIAFYYFD
jgi:hypothetical protein